MYALLLTLTWITKLINFSFSLHFAFLANKGLSKTHDDMTDRNKADGEQFKLRKNDSDVFKFYELATWIMEIPLFFRIT